MPVNIQRLRQKLRGLDTRRERLHAAQAVLDKAAGQYLRQLRIDRWIKLRQVAHAAGFSIGKLWEIEQGVRTGGLSLETFNQVAKAIKEVKP